MEAEEATNAQLVAKKSRTKDDDEDDYDSRIGDSEEGKARRLTVPGSNLALSSPGGFEGFDVGLRQSPIVSREVQASAPSQ